MNEPSPSMLERIVTGELAADDPAVVRRCLEDEDFASALTEFVRAGAALDDAAALRNEVIEEAQARATPEDLAITKASLKESIGARDKSGWYGHLPILSALAAAAVAAFMLWPTVDAPAPIDLPDGLLSGGATQILAPRGEVKSFEKLVLDYDALAAFRDVEVEVLSSDGRIVLMPRTRLREEEWTLTDQQRATLTAAGRIRIVVTATSRLGGDEEVFEAAAWLPSSRPR